MSLRLAGSIPARSSRGGSRDLARGAERSSGWRLSLLRLAGRPAAISLAGALLSFACPVVVARLVVTRRALDHRVAMPALSVSLGPSTESAVLFAPRLSGS